MGIRDAINGLWMGLTKGAVIPATPGKGALDVINTLTQAPSQSNVPGSWARYWLGPGKPFTTETTSIIDKEREKEPRSFQYNTSVNSTISPRLAYGLMSFADLKFYAQNVPEVAMCIRLLTEECKAFVPTIEDLDDNPVDPDNKYQWMCDRPDRFNPWPVWLSRFLYNVEAYDAGTVYKVRQDNGDIMAARIIDGSTIFALIDERGEIPSPPAPAFQQIIWGVPRMYLNTYQLWYKPRHLRPDAPYGRAAIEDAFASVVLLHRLWDYEADKYLVGNIPEMAFSVPEDWKENADQILEYEEAFNARMAGSNTERVRARFLPAGMTVLQTKELSFNKESYDVATNSVRMAFGIPQSEVGETPSGGLGGSGYQEAMQSAFYRMGLAPLLAYIESLFNDIIKENGDGDTVKFKLEFPPESLDPSKEEEKFSTRFQIGGITRNEYRQGLGMQELDGEIGDFIVTPGGGAGEEDEGSDGEGSGIGVIGGNKKSLPVVGGKGTIGVKRMVDVKNMLPVKKYIGVDPDDDQYYGADIERPEHVNMPNEGANGSYIVSLKLQGKPAKPAVWKPEAEEDNSLRSWIGGPLHHREEAAYLLDRELAYNEDNYLVPVTFTEVMNGTDGSVQMYIRGRKERRKMGEYAPVWQEYCAVFDYITGQVDRVNKNYFTHPYDQSRPIFFDNGLSFPKDKDQHLHSSFIDYMRGKPLSENCLEAVYLLVGNKSIWQDLFECLGDMEPVQNAKDRAERLIEKGMIPIDKPVKVNKAVGNGMEESHPNEHPYLPEKDVPEKPEGDRFFNEEELREAGKKVVQPGDVELLDDSDEGVPGAMIDESKPEEAQPLKKRGKRASNSKPA